MQGRPEQGEQEDQAATHTGAHTRTFERKHPSSSVRKKKLAVAGTAAGGIADGKLVRKHATISGTLTLGLLFIKDNQTQKYAIVWIRQGCSCRWFLPSTPRTADEDPLI